jgi:xylulokinase
MALLLGIDLGTSSAKALLFDADSGQILSVGQQEYPLLQPAPMYAEQNPEDWWQATVQAVNQCLQDSDRWAVSAIGLTGQMHGGAFLDDAYQPIAPAIIWADGRSGAVAQAMIEQIGEERFCQIAGTVPAAGFFASTLVWLKQNDPELLNHIGHIVLPKDYLRLKLTGELAAEISDASATGLFDIVNGDWSQELITAFDLPPAIFPEILPSAFVAGTLLPSVAETLDLPAGIPVIAGCSDQPAQAITNALITPGAASLTIGTGGQVFAPVAIRPDQPTPTDPRLHVFCHAVPEMHYLLGATLSAGLSLRWLRNLLELQSQSDAYALLSAEASQVAPGADGLIFLPYLAGERTPYMDAQARGGFIGLRLHHTRGHMARAVMEGVAFSMRQVLELVLMTGHLSIERVIASGGALESDVWRQIVTDVVGLPLVRSLSREQTATGAALLAGIGSGRYASFDEASTQTARFTEPTLPETSTQGIYNDIYTQFCELYPTLKMDFHRLSNR